MVKTTQEHINGAAARFAADNANDGAVKRATKTPEEKAAILRTHAEKCMQAGSIEAAASWLRLAARIERGQRLG